MLFQMRAGLSVTCKRYLLCRFTQTGPITTYAEHAAKDWSTICRPTCVTEFCWLTSSKLSVSIACRQILILCCSHTFFFFVFLSVFPSLSVPSSTSSFFPPHTCVFSNIVCRSVVRFPVRISTWTLTLLSEMICGFFFSPSRQIPEQQL